MDTPTIWVIAGTSEARYLIKQLEGCRVKIYASVATGYGEQLLDKQDNLQVLNQRLEIPEMQLLLGKIKPRLVIDATHPYARLVTENIAQVCQGAGVPLLRVKRSDSVEQDDVVYLDSIEQAVKFLGNTQGNILLTTGSKDLQSFTQISAYQERIFVRILPMLDSLSKALELGFAPSKIICMQGPFSLGMNKALLEMCEAKYLVTKDSGASGGFEEKLQAARKLNIKVVVISRPQEQGYLVADLLQELQKKYGF